MITVVVENSQNILKNENKIIIDIPSDINHIKNVFRKTIGDSLRVVDGKNEYLCKIFYITNDKIILNILEKNIQIINKNIKIDAGICLLKNDKMDLTIQKLTEIGINKIIPISAKRSISKLNQKKPKWEIIVRESMKQCQGINFTKIDEIKKIQELNFSIYDLIIVPYECEKDFILKNILNQINNIPKRILFIIGPEGGFEIEEIKFLKQNNANIISLGERILRAETAAIVTGGILIHEFQ